MQFPLVSTGFCDPNLDIEMNALTNSTKWSRIRISKISEQSQKSTDVVWRAYVLATGNFRFFIQIFYDHTAIQFLFLQTGRFSTCITSLVFYNCLWNGRAHSFDISKHLF